jgi:multiple sugar transport system substrate-binding protein
MVHDKYLMDYKMKNPVWDLVMIDTFWIGNWVDSGLVVPVGKIIKDHPDWVDEKILDINGFFQPHIQTFTYKNELSGFPEYSFGVCMFYRKDLFDDPTEKESFLKQYGYELTPPATYREFYDIAKFFTRKKGETLAGKTLDYDFYGTVFSDKEGNFLWNDFDTIFMAFGADNIFNPKTMQPTFNSPEMIEALKYYISLSPFQPEGHVNMTSGEASSLTAKGYVAMQIEYLIRGSEVLLGKDSAVADKIGIMPCPSKEGVKGREHAAHAGGDGVGISSLSKNQEATFKLLQLAFSERIEKKVLIEKFSNGGWQPPRTSILSDPVVEKLFPYIKDATKLLTSKEIFYFDHPAYFVAYQECVTKASSELSKALVGLKTPEQACNDGQQELIEIFKREGFVK